MRIGIIGCGVSGQAAAIALSRDGHDVTVFERFADARPLGAGLLLQPSGLAALSRLGLRAEVERWGAPVERLDGRTSDGRKVLQLSYRGECGLGIHRAALFNALHEALQNSSAQLVLGFEVKAIKNPDAPVLIAGTQNTGPFDLVLNCAGAHDGLRGAMGTRRMTDPIYPWGALWTTCIDRHRNFGGALRQIYRRCSTMIGILPVGRVPGSDDAHVAFFWSLPLAQYETQKAAGVDALKREVIALWPEAEPIVAQVSRFEDLSLATYRDVTMRPCHVGRVLAIGDAAHATSPQLGQGANLSLIDAVTLARCLKYGGDTEAALAAFEKMRWRHIAYYRTASRWLTPLFQSNSRLLAFARDTFMGPMRFVPGADYLMRTTLEGIRCLPWGLCKLPKA